MTYSPDSSLEMLSHLKISLIFSLFHNIIAGTVLCFGGGVLLGTVFMHMLKEVRESMEEAVSMGFWPEIADYPFSELLICLGKNTS